MVERLQVKACSIGRILNNLEKKYNNPNDDKESLKKSPSGHLVNASSKRDHQKIQIIPPFNASKIRKSPSAESASSVSVAQKEDAKELDIEEETVEECSQQ